MGDVDVVERRLTQELFVRLCNGEIVFRIHFYSGGISHLKTFRLKVALFTWTTSVLWRGQKLNSSEMFGEEFGTRYNYLVTNNGELLFVFVLSLVFCLRSYATIWKFHTPGVKN